MAIEIFGNENKLRVKFWATHYEIRVENMGKHNGLFI